MGNSIACVQKPRDPERSKEQTYSQASEAMERETTTFFPPLGFKGPAQNLLQPKKSRKCTGLRASLEEGICLAKML